MPLSADSLVERVRLKTQLTRWRIFAVLVSLGLAFLLFSPKDSLKALEENHVARLTIEDVIWDDPAREELIQSLIDNPRVKAVIVRLNTPGGSGVAGQEIYFALRRLAEHKPVVAVMRDVAASAGYMVALGADYIIAREGTLTGSIGVLMQTAEFTELAEKLGITPITVKSAPLKATPSPLEKFTPEERAAMDSVIQDFYHVFVDMVAERRKLEPATALKLADGRVYTGRQALNNKLIDALGGEEEARAWLAGQEKIALDLPLKDAQLPEEPQDLLHRLLEESGARAVMKNFPVKLDGIAAIWQPSIL